TPTRASSPPPGRAAPTSPSCATRARPSAAPTPSTRTCGSRWAWRRSSRSGARPSPASPSRPRGSTTSRRGACSCTTCRRTTARSAPRRPSTTRAAWCSTRPRTGCTPTRRCWCSSSRTGTTEVSAQLRVGVLGASGYGGAGLLERLARHPHARVVAVGSRQYAGQGVDACWPRLAGLFPGLVFAGEDEVIAASDVVFCATPHGATAPVVKKALDAGRSVVDLSADFRLSAGSYAEWYGGEHPHPELIPEAVYGLVELHRDELVAKRLIASPGCNATAASLALAPLAAAGLLGPTAVVNVVTGVSGAGRATSGPL